MDLQVKEKVFGAACRQVEAGHPEEEAVGLREEVVSLAVAEVLEEVEVVGDGKLKIYS